MLDADRRGEFLRSQGDTPKASAKVWCATFRQRSQPVPPLWGPRQRPQTLTSRRFSRGPFGVRPFQKAVRIRERIAVASSTVLTLVRTAANRHGQNNWAPILPQRSMCRKEFLRHRRAERSGTSRQNGRPPHQTFALACRFKRRRKGNSDISGASVPVAT